MNWEVNTLEPKGFNQTYKAADGDAVETTSVSCATTSLRTSSTFDSSAYKVGDTVRIASGYKIRDSKTATYGLVSKSDGEVKETKLTAFETGAMSLYGSAIAMTLATLLAF